MNAQFTKASYAKVVIDASIAISSVIAETQSPIALRILKEYEIGKWELTVPAIFWCEFTNGLMYAAKKQQIDLTDIEQSLKLWNKYKINCFANSINFSWYLNLISLAQQYKLTAYDTSYLAVALETKATLATFDKALMAAAKACKIQLFT